MDETRISILKIDGLMSLNSKKEEEGGWDLGMKCSPKYGESQNGNLLPFHRNDLQCHKLLDCNLHTHNPEKLFKKQKKQKSKFYNNFQFILNQKNYTKYLLGFNLLQII